MLPETKVNRLEDRKSTGATVLETDGENVRISYDEGGEGWWPISVLAAEAGQEAPRPAATSNGPVELPLYDIPNEEVME